MNLANVSPKNKRTFISVSRNYKIITLKLRIVLKTQQSIANAKTIVMLLNFYCYLYSYFWIKVVIVDALHNKNNLNGKR